MNTIKTLTVTRTKRLFLMGIVFACVATSAACGYRMRGAINLPYQSIHLSGTMSVELRQYLSRGIEIGTNAKLVSAAKDAELMIEVLQDINSKQILSYNSAGQITAYRLVNVVKFRAFDNKGNELISDSDVYLTRDMDFSISTILAAEMMELELITSMRQDIAAQILRRIGALQAKVPKK